MPFIPRIREYIICSHAGYLVSPRRHILFEKDACFARLVACLCRYSERQWRQWDVNSGHCALIYPGHLLLCGASLFGLCAVPTAVRAAPCAKSRRLCGHDGGSCGGGRGLLTCAHLCDIMRCYVHTLCVLVGASACGGMRFEMMAYVTQLCVCVES